MGSVIGKGVCVCVKYLNHVCVFLIDYDDEEEYDEDEYYDDEDDEGNDPTLTVFHKANMKRRTRLDQRNRFSLPDYDDEEEDLLGEEQYMNEKVILRNQASSY